MTKTGTYTITASGMKELDEPKEWARTKLPQTLAETLLDGKAHSSEDLYSLLHRFDTNSKIAAKLASWTRRGWIKKTEAAAVKVEKSARRVSPAQVETENEEAEADTSTSNRRLTTKQGRHFFARE
jgi:hypothetical protein